jgi:hypothetical protein
MNDSKLRAAEALYPMLSAFHSVEGQTLRSVSYVHAESCLDRVILNLDTEALWIAADPDDDSIEVGVASVGSLQSSGLDVSRNQPWSELLGRPLGWGWIAINQQGYSDAVLLSFDGVVFPLIVLTVVASSIDVGLVSKV